MSEPTQTPLESAAPDNDHDAPATESTPLLSNQSTVADEEDADEHDDTTTQPTRWSLWPRGGKTSRKPARKLPWASIIAITILGLLVIFIILVGFLVPPAVKQYAETAAVLEPTNLSLESINPDGVRVRIQANFRLDASRVSDDSTRRIGKFATTFVRKLETGETTVQVSLPHYDNSLIGSAVVPPLTISLVNGHTTAMDFITTLAPGDADKIRSIANDWLEGNLEQVTLSGAASLDIKSGILPLGKHNIVESFVLEAGDIPAMPDYKIKRLDLHDLPPDETGKKAVGADVSIVVHNDYPVSLEIPALDFEVLVPNCNPSEPYIRVGDAATSIIEVLPKDDVIAQGRGTIREISQALVRICPRTKLSPLDTFMKRYLNGENAEIFVRGKKSVNPEVPEWIGSILEGITAPLEFPGRPFGNLIRNFSVTDVHFTLPSPFAEPNDPDGQPRVSGTIQVLAALPDDFNIDVGVHKLRADADLYYKDQKMGELNLHEWQKANSVKIPGIGSDDTLLNITSSVVDVPLNITDGDVFGDVLQKVLFGDDDINLDVKALVHIEVSTVLGSLFLKDVPAQGTFPVKRLPANSLTDLSPQVNDMRIISTTDTGFMMKASINVTNPTPYTASIPHANVHIYEQEAMIGEANATQLDVRLGNNSNLSVSAIWDPQSFGGIDAHRIAKRLLSDYISGKNTTLTFRAHRHSFPHMPDVGQAVSRFNFTLPLPRMKLPGSENDDDQHFIRDAIFHLLSSTATFTLASPLHYNTIYIEHISAVAYYNHTEPVGQIVYDQPFAAPPGLSRTPRLPVEWSAGRVGYDKLKEALGGSLKLDAVANVTMRLGNWVETIYYEGKGIGAKVSL
ncbi:hypothetical protein S7711_06562 [Stachybotrys chartarum IBT 7711]|uniref:Pre-rRNA processing protein n=1 Tax=Stachybotrys chartarum (strain CBS 109288 / IBT 7711) TaxID=1280523 RepID=A0A084AYL5_STACB|nr:hypothetical protein S7711_06562 [Stachybotrys chartarum IBT 7711]